MASIPTKPKKFIPAPWQLEDLGQLAMLDNSANWSEMGCYKTSTVLWLAEKKVSEIENPSILIVTTSSGKGTYFEAIPEILPGWTIFNVTTQGVKIVLPGGKEVKIGKHLKDEIAVPHVVLTHYNVFSKCNRNKPQMVKVWDETKGKQVSKPVTVDGKIVFMPWTQADYLIKRHWSFIGVDEAHRIKNKDTSWVTNMKKLRAPHKHVMTGTGIINRPSELWSLLNFLEPDEYSSSWKFKTKFCQMGDILDQDGEPSGYVKEVGVKPEYRDELRNIIRTIGVRRTLGEVRPDIDVPIFTRIDVDLNPTQKRMYQELKSELRMLDQRGEAIDSPNVLAMLSRLRQICVATPEIVEDRYDEKLEKRVQVVRLVEPSSKLDALMEIIEGLEWDDENKQQLVVFSNFKDPLYLLEKRLEASKVPYIHMLASDNDKVRYDKWFTKWPKKEHQVFMSTLSLGSESINLSSAQYLVFLDRSWSPKDNDQGVGRIYRPGQTGQAMVINIEAKGTVDRRVENTVKQKKGWFQELFGNEDNDD